ncbi:uncharacterized protein LOC117218082 isoform X1 [Megalopta genalis]|uniref:uncharacterized protein LOC117218082 isoform X1 n=1 Tax=Megalopta genalis TaxID=115081 RepID=UPI003FD5A568
MSRVVREQFRSETETKFLLTSKISDIRRITKEETQIDASERSRESSHGDCENREEAARTRNDSSLFSKGYVRILFVNLVFVHYHSQLNGGFCYIKCSIYEKSEEIKVESLLKKNGTCYVFTRSIGNTHAYPTPT